MALSPVRPSLHQTQRPSGKGLSHACQMVHTAEDLIPIRAMGPGLPGAEPSRGVLENGLVAVGCFICHRDENSPLLGSQILLQALGILF